MGIQFTAVVRGASLSVDLSKCWDSSSLKKVSIHSSKETSNYDITSCEGDSPLYPLAIGNINEESSTSTSCLPYRFVLGVIHCITLFYLLIPFLAGLLGEMMEPERPSITVLYFVPLSGGILYHIIFDSGGSLRF